MGCEVGVMCIGVACRTASPCTILNATIVGATGSGYHIFGVRCLTGGCASLAGNDVRAGTMSTTSAGPEGIGLEIDGASPAVDDNRVVGSNGDRGDGRAVYARTCGHRSLLTNNDRGRRPPHSSRPSADLTTMVRR